MLNIAAHLNRNDYHPIEHDNEMVDLYPARILTKCINIVFSCAKNYEGFQIICDVKLLYYSFNISVQAILTPNQIPVWERDDFVCQR